MLMDASNATAVTMYLRGGPLADQRLTVHTRQGGSLPGVIFPHAPLPHDHPGEPGPRHTYFLSPDREYHHSDRCPCRLPLAG
jgi:hypothetical protein